MDLTLHHLRLLREVSVQGTIAAAAASLGFTPSAVSQQLAGLERACGVAVLERAGRNVRLTDAGRELVRHADRLLAQAEEALVAVEQVSASIEGVVEIAVYESVGATLLPPLLQRLDRRYPDLEIRSRQRDPYLAIEELLHGDIDLAFTIDYSNAPTKPRSDVTRWTVVEDQYHLITADRDALGPGPVDIMTLRDRRFIGSPPESSCGRWITAACRSAGFEPDITHALDDYPTALRLVAAGVGIALIPDLGLIDPPPGIRVVELREPFSRLIQLACRTASAGRPSLVAIHDELAAVIAELELRPARAA